MENKEKRADLDKGVIVKNKSAGIAKEVQSSLYKQNANEYERYI